MIYASEHPMGCLTSLKSEYQSLGANRRAHGFTLIELMIVVAVIAILAAIAYPSYKEQVAKSRRGQLISILMEGQQWMERFYTENYRYDKNSANVAVTDKTQFGNPADGGRFAYSPKVGDGARLYEITVTPDADDPSNKYAIKATRVASAAMGADRCGDYEVNQYGIKHLLNYSGFSSEAAALEFCWK